MTTPSPRELVAIARSEIAGFRDVATLPVRTVEALADTLEAEFDGRTRLAMLEQSHACGRPCYETRRVYAARKRPARAYGSIEDFPAADDPPEIVERRCILAGEHAQHETVGPDGTRHTWPNRATPPRPALWSIDLAPGRGDTPKGVR